MGTLDTLAKLEARVRALEAAEEIRKLVGSYALAAGAGDEELWVGQFAEDAVLEQTWRPEDKSTGKEELRSFFRKMLAPGLVKHQQAHNLCIEVEGDTARGTSMWMAERRQPDGTVVRKVGRYHDEYVKTERGWKFKKRILTLDA